MIKKYFPLISIVFVCTTLFWKLCHAGTFVQYTPATVLPINVKLPPYNADSTGSVDCSTNVQTAISALPNGGTLFFPKGTYKMSITFTGAGASNITVMGEGLGTLFVPISTTAFVFNSIENYAGFDHLYKDFQIVQTGGYGVGRGFYFNNAAFNDVQNVRLDGLEYGIYSNSTEWGHLFNMNIKCKYGLIFTTLNSDILGNGPHQVAQNPAYWYIDQTHIWGNAGDGPGIGVYLDNKDDPIGDHNSAIYVHDSDLIQNPLNVAIGEGGNNGSRFNPMHLENVFINNTVSTVTQTFNGFTLNNGDLYANNANVYLEDIHMEDNINITGNTRLTGNNVSIASGFPAMAVNISTTAVCLIDNLVSDNNGGFVFDQIEGRNFQPVSAGRPLTMRLPTARSSFLYLSTGNANTDTVSCAFGGLPGIQAGAPNISFFKGDGFYHDRCIRVSGVAGDSVKWRPNLVTGRYYATTYSMRADISTTVATGNSLAFFSGNGSIHLSKDWRTFGAIVQSAFTGTAIVFFTLNGPTTFYVSSVQMAEFNDFDAAQNYLDSGSLIIPPSEVFGLPLATILTSTSAYVGEDLTCSNCNLTTICVSTGITLAGQYVISSSSNTKCQ